MTSSCGLVSLIILNWNNKDIISKCLDSALCQTYEPLEIIVVDNGSTDGSLEQIQSAYSNNIKIIKNHKNLGFAEGVNIGIQHTRGEWVALLNSDAIADSRWLEEMFRAVQQSDSVGMCACKIYLADKDNILDNTGEVMCRDGLNRGRGRLEVDHGQYDQSSDVFCPSGCAALYKKKMLDEAGLMDKHFFAYGEDMDIGLRGRLLGYNCVYAPRAIVHHQLSASAGKVSPFKAYYVERNRLWIVLKCFPIYHLIVSPFYTLARYFYHLSGVFSKKGPAATYVKEHSFLQLILSMTKGYCSTIYYLPHLFRERKKLNERAVCREEFDSWLNQYGISVKEAALNEIH